MRSGSIAMLVFGLFEQWPKRLPRWLGRWALQVVAVAIAMPISTVVIYLASTEDGAPPFWEVQDRMEGFGFLCGMSIFLAPWVALGALVRQKEAVAREQALAFDLERSEYERQALDARLHLLQAQVAPHFLFNTLANVQALVDAGSPQASAVLRSLVAYLRAAVPRINERVTTLGQELQLVQAYLELMHMRMPDRLKFAVNAEPSTLSLRCPPMTILTLVENAVRHGIDPSEEGGQIEIRVERQGQSLPDPGQRYGRGPAAFRRRARHGTRNAPRAPAARLRRGGGAARCGAPSPWCLRGAGAARQGIAVVSSNHPTALIADDEPLLREALSSQLKQAWPELEIVAQARNGREAVQLFESRRPDICFLDVHMPGISGVEAARYIGRQAHLVFVTAYDQYAVEAFAQGVLDYLVKPVEAARLAETVARLKERLAAAQPASNTDHLLLQLAEQLARFQGGSPAPLRWIRAQVGQTLRLISVDEIDYLRADTKYTRVAWRGDGGRTG